MDRRAANFTKEEVQNLVALVGNFKNVVECKKSDNVSWNDKVAIWATISDRLVEIGFPLRTTKQLRDKWCNLKKDTKKKYGEERVETYKTGGGPRRVIQFTALDEQIKSIIGVAITGESNPFDSDGVCNIYTDTQEDNEDEHQLLDGVGDSYLGSQEIFHGNNWASWNPAALKTPVAAELSKQQEPNFKQPLVGTWTPKRLRIESNTALNDKNLGKFLVLENPKLLAVSSHQNERETRPEIVSRPVSVPRVETITRPVPVKTMEIISRHERVSSPEIPVDVPLSDVAGPSHKQNCHKTPQSGMSSNMSGVKKKTALTNDCRVKINALSQSKLELIEIEKECLKKELLMKEKEHELKIEQMKEAHSLSQRKGQVELKLLELELRKKEMNEFH